MGNVHRFTVTLRSWHAPLSFSALVVCLCSTTLGVSSVLIGYGMLSQILLLTVLAVSLLAGAAVSGNEVVSTFLRSGYARVLAFFLLSLLWLAPFAARFQIGVLQQWSLAPGWAFAPALGLAVLISRYLRYTEHESGRPLFRSALLGAFLSICFLMIFDLFCGTLLGSGVLFLVVVLACLQPASAAVIEMPERSPSTTSEKLLLAGFCAVGFAFPLLGGLALRAQASQGMDAIYLAGALVVLVFLAGQLSFARMQKIMSGSQIALGCVALASALSVYVALYYRGDLMQGIRAVIMLLGCVCFITGALLFISLYAHFAGRRYVRTALFAQGILYGSMALATAFVWTWRPEPTEDTVLILLLLVALVVTGFLALLLSHRKLVQIISLTVGVAGAPEPSESVTAPSLEDRCRQLQHEYRLTAREGEVLLQAARGRTAIAIARDLYISRDTANTHVQHIYRKLGVSSRDELIELVDTLMDQSSHQSQ